MINQRKMSAFAKLFPSIPTKEWKQVNLDREFRESKFDMKTIDGQNQLLSKVSNNGTYYTFGGFREDRSLLWEGFEGDNQMIHLGVDFNNLSPGDKVASISDGVVFDILVDITPFNGWGTKIIIEDEKYYYLYGHLMNTTLSINQQIKRPSELVKHPSGLVKRGEIIGEIASSDKNGGWFPHLHLQIMEKKELNLNIREVDGYEFVKGTVKGVIDPMKLLYNKKD